MISLGTGFESQQCQNFLISISIYFEDFEFEIMYPEIELDKVSEMRLSHSLPFMHIEFYFDKSKLCVMENNNFRKKKIKTSE